MTQAIHSWNDVPDGTKVIEDTYNEVWKIFTTNDGRFLKQVGWQMGNKPVPEDNIIWIDFEPDCTWDQPWYIL